MATFAFDTALFPVLVAEYPDLPATLVIQGHRLTVADVQLAQVGPDAAMRAAFDVFALDTVPYDKWEHLLQVLQAIRPSRGDAPEPTPAPGDDLVDARLVARCVESGHVLVCGRRAVAETAWKHGVAAKNLREFLKFIGDPRHRFLDEQTGR